MIGQGGLRSRTWMTVVFCGDRVMSAENNIGSANHISRIFEISAIIREYAESDKWFIRIIRSDMPRNEHDTEKPKSIVHDIDFETILQLGEAYFLSRAK